MADQTQIQTPEEQAQLEAAALEYLARKTRKSDPKGDFDRAGRWYPTPEIEEQACCCCIRPPSSKFPYSILTHCRTFEHISWLFKVDIQALKKLVKEKTKAAKG